MTPTPAAQVGMEPPECPVCLQSYDGDTTIPRVLGCGHSACEPCLAHLNLLRPITLPHTLRCPSCTQLVNFPHPQGPSALPKNIDLLRFSLLLQDQDRDQDQHTNSKPQKNNSNKPLLNDNSSLRRRFLPRIWSEELYSAWKDWILPYGAVSIEDELVSTTGRINISSNFVDLSLSSIMRCRLVENHVVGLVKVGRFVLSDPLLEYSYVGKIMRVLSLMSDYQRNEISNILGVSMKYSRVCRVLGLWLNVENDGFLYLVTEKLNNGFLNSGNLGYEIDQYNTEWGCLLGSIGVDLCEAIISLHSEGFVCGFLNMSCLCFDEFGHVCIDIGEALVMGRKFRQCFVEGIKGGREIDGFDVELFIGNMLDMGAFVSPEVWMELLGRENIEVDKNDVSYPVCYKSDSWLLACVLINLLIGNKISVEMYNYLKFVFQGKNERVSEYKINYLQWIETINAMLEPSVGTEYASVHEILLKCLAFDPGTRPLVTDVWKCIKGLRSYHFINNVSSLDSGSMKENIGQCLALGELCNILNDARNESRISKLPEEHDDCKPNRNLVGENTVDNVVKGLSAGKLQCKVLQGHLDCVTGLCVGGGYLFSSSFDKTINVWSLQDFVHVHTFKGHEHKVMALVFLNQETPLCISADSGGGIYAWEINETLAQEPLKKWYEEKDWRYSGIHALAVSESGCLYTGSGDRLIKAWSLRDYTLLCSMEGHKSVVATLALCNGILYSGSWDGTVRLWCLHDHSPLAVFGEDIPGTVSSVLSLVVDQNMIIAAHENGCIKMWVDDEFKTSTKIQNGATLALAMDGRWLFLGGWGRTINVQEITGSESEMDILEVGSIACDSVITAIRCVQGALFVGYANKLVKVYYCDA
ncbi:uncharacterized protein LOC110697582 isoform X2 [Chenopodium quinoa]|uniref:uncharacterized protein LOC110697582 isoform X2 n=1 Tax=Chenopodium quinoa TaxID=63459 RepID=UPI000B782175|nr:uncharacterized protein LOC110697582 isoform X2 [Chenopodium quinoa]